MSTVYHIHKILTVETLPFPAPGMLAYKCTLQDGDETETWEGVCAEDHLPTPKDLRPQDKVTVLSDGKGARDLFGYWILTTEERIRVTAEEGYLSREYVPNIFDEGLFDEGLKGPYTLLQEGAKMVPVLVVDHAHMIFDADGPLPVAVSCSYSQGSFDNIEYDLEKAIAHLRTHPHVRDLCDGPLGIDWYNRDGGRTHHITFRWCPDVETYRKVWTWRLSSGWASLSWGLFEAIHTHDILGLRACGASLRKT